MYLQRKIDSFLAQWKNSSGKKPLIVRGARQIGKTESILHFAKENYDSVVYINFALEKKYATITSNGYTAESVIKNISLLNTSFRFITGSTVVFFDEIQDFPDIATSLKSFCEDGRFDVICSGSMLGLNYRKIHSNSVGYKTDYQMYSMDFEEFLWANGYNTVADDILNHMALFSPFSATETAVYNSLFFDYAVVGGMPEAVASFVQNRTFEDIVQIQKQINLDYEEDARKYAFGLDQAKIIGVYRSIPAQLAKENKKFQFSVISSKARSRDYQGCLEWLSDCGVVNMCYCLNFPELPIKGNENRSKFKVYYADTGILISQLDEESQLDLRANRNLGTYKGAVFENLVSEAFVKQGLGIVYYKREDSTLEEDFFVRTVSELIPVEVKAGRADSQSLRTLIKSEHYPDIKHGIKLCSKNVGFENGIITFPLFCAFRIKDFLRKF